LSFEVYPNIFEIFQVIPSPFDACLREAASAKAGGRGRVGVDKTETVWFPLLFIPSLRGEGRSLEKTSEKS
jgi:hypothetical protein